LLEAARNAVETKCPSPARFIVESVLDQKPEHPDDVAVMTVFFE
jgi:hypothetical protein